MRRTILLGAGAAVFCSLATLNAGGYRYGVSDQAFYIPVVLQQLTPDLYPNDAPLIAAPDRLFAFDDWFAPILRVTGASLTSAFFVAYSITLFLLYGGIAVLGRALYTTSWAVAGLVIGMTMRHRIPDTAVNTLEGYFHPRLLAFAVGVWGVAVFLRGRTWLALAVAVGAMFVHPITGLWFVVLVGVAAVTADGTARPRLVVLGSALSLLAVGVLMGPLREQLVVMDARWLALLEVKNYLRPSEWPPLTWVGNLGTAVVIGAVYRRRRQLGLVTPRETGLVAGCAVLLGAFFVSVPLSSAHVALAVQLQVNRIFWLLDVVGSCYLGWWLIERPQPVRGSGPRVAIHPRPVVVIVMFALALSRGSYVMFVEQAGQPLIRTTLAHSDWQGVMDWAATQPIGTHFLAAPDHATRYGTSVRVASGRDVYVEVVKDTGMAIYSVDIAHRVLERLEELGHFDTLNEDRALSLAWRYDLDFLITDHTLELPEAHVDGSLRVYDLTGVARVASAGN